MTIYSVITIILLLLFLVEQRGVSENVDKKLFLVASFCVFFISAFRGENVGGDMIEYVHFWQGKDDMYGTWKSPNEALTFEPGLSWFCYFLHLFNNGEAWFFVFFTTLVIQLPFFYLIWRDSSCKVLSVLLYMVLWGLLDISYTGLRQVIGGAMCIMAYIVWTTPFRMRGFKYLILFFLIGFSLSFHTVTYFCVPLYCAFMILKGNRNLLNLIILLSTLVFGIVFSKVAPVLFEMTGALFASFDLLFRLNHYFDGIGVDDGLREEAVIGLKQILTTLIVCLIVSFSNKDRCNNFYVNCLVFGCSLFSVFVSFPNAGRFLFPYLFVGIICSPSKNLINRAPLYKFLFITFVVILSLHQIHTWEKGFGDKNSSFYVFNQMFPYNFIWE